MFRCLNCRNVVNTFLLIYQLGTCCVYVVFVASNIKSIADFYMEDKPDVRIYMLIILLPLILINWVSKLSHHARDTNETDNEIGIPQWVNERTRFRLLIWLCRIRFCLINWQIQFVLKKMAEVIPSNRFNVNFSSTPLKVRNLKYLAPFSTIANAVTLISFAIILYYIFREPISLEGKDAFGELKTFPLFFGTVLFALEAIGVVSTFFSVNIIWNDIWLTWTVIT